jgi:hypothetical protein
MATIYIAMRRRSATPQSLLRTVDLQSDRELKEIIIPYKQLPRCGELRTTFLWTRSVAAELPIGR